MRASDLVRLAIMSGALLAPSSVRAQSPFALVWLVQPATQGDDTERDIADGEYIVRQKLLPLGLAVLKGDVALPKGGKLIARSDAQLVRLGGRSGTIYCALETWRSDKAGATVPNKASTTLCLLDADRDGRFEAGYEAASSPTGIIMDAAPPKQPTPIEAAYEQRPADELRGDFWIGVRYEQYFNIYGNRMLFTDFGGRGERQSLTAFDKFKSKGTYPRDVAVMGAKMTILSAAPKGIRVRVDKALPPQPFGVFRTVSYRFY